MRRLARLDPPGILHRMIIRGIERRRIFRDLQGVVDFVDMSNLAGIPYLVFSAESQNAKPRFPSESE